jgi:hypothetical protein
VCGDQHGRAEAVCALLKQLQRLVAASGVQIPGWLIGDHDLGRRRQRPRDCHTLHLPAGKLVRHRRGFLGKPHPAQSVHRRRYRLSSQQQRQLHVLEHGKRRQELKELKHEPDPFAPKRRQLAFTEHRGGAAVDQNFARGREIHRPGKIEQRALPAAATPHQRRDRSRFQPQRDIAKRLDILSIARIDFGDLT